MCTSIPLYSSKAMPGNYTADHTLPNHAVTSPNYVSKNIWKFEGCREVPSVIFCGCEIFGMVSAVFRKLIHYHGLDAKQYQLALQPGWTLDYPIYHSRLLHSHFIVSSVQWATCISGLLTATSLAMVKSSSLVFVLLFAFLFRLEIFSIRLIGVIGLIVSGVVLMVATETHFVLGGFLLVISGSALSGLRWSLTQLLLKDTKLGMDNPVATVFWLAPVMGITLAIISMVIEGWISIFRGVFFSDLAHTLKSLFFLTAPGFLAFSMILSEF